MREHRKDYSLPKLNHKIPLILPKLNNSLNKKSFSFYD
jgi:hypothetical protein